MVSLYDLLLLLLLLFFSHSSNFTSVFGFSLFEEHVWCCCICIRWKGVYLQLACREPHTICIQTFFFRLFRLKTECEVVSTALAHIPSVEYFYAEKRQTKQLNKSIRGFCWFSQRLIGVYSSGYSIRHSFYWSLCQYAWKTASDNVLQPCLERKNEKDSFTVTAKHLNTMKKKSFSYSRNE